MQQLLIQFPIKQDKKEIWISLLNSKIGLPYTKTMDGFISAEHGISKDKDNNLIWHLWKNGTLKKITKTIFLHHSALKLANLWRVF